METFFWYDYETWGSNPKVDRPSQFAGVRTDLEFNIVGESLVLYCKPPPDLLPQPEACLVNGITPQQAESKGVFEYQFIAAIYQELSQPNTCSVGYNNIRFDDEVTRNLLYRNFYDVYGREWKNGNSRWDIIDLVRACYALRPEGINWPRHEDGRPSFKLEHLTSANGLRHEESHDALSDVYATIAVARMVRDKQPKLFNYLYKLRCKHEVMKLINLASKRPVLHVSSMFSAERGCAALMMPLAVHPTNKNEIICYDLSVDPAPLINLSADEIRKRVFSSKEDLNGNDRVPLKSIHINRCPVVCNDNILTDDIAERVKIDRVICESNYKKLLAEPLLSAKLNTIFTNSERFEITDPEKMLYSGFFSNEDQAIFHQVRKANGIDLREGQFNFQDKRLPELLFRYRARNFPKSLTASESERWLNFCYQRLTNSSFGASIVSDSYREEIARLNAEVANDSRRKEILSQLLQYLDSIFNTQALAAG